MRLYWVCEDEDESIHKNNLSGDYNMNVMKVVFDIKSRYELR